MNEMEFAVVAAAAIVLLFVTEPPATLNVTVPVAELAVTLEPRLTLPPLMALNVMPPAPLTRAEVAFVEMPPLPEPMVMAPVVPNVLEPLMVIDELLPVPPKVISPLVVKGMLVPIVDVSVKIRLLLADGWKVNLLLFVIVSTVFVPEIVTVPAANVRVLAAVLLNVLLPVKLIVPVSLALKVNVPVLMNELLPLKLIVLAPAPEVPTLMLLSLATAPYVPEPESVNVLEAALSFRLIVSLLPVPLTVPLLVMLGALNVIAVLAPLVTTV